MGLISGINIDGNLIGAAESRVQAVRNSQNIYPCGQQRRQPGIDLVVLKPIGRMLYEHT